MKRVWQVLIVSLVTQLLLVGSTYADPSSSANYSIVESTVGGTGGTDSASTSYKSIGSDNGGLTLGDTAVGNSSSTNFQTNSGFNTSETPALTFVLNTTSVNFGILSSGAARMGSASFSVKNYTSYGYIVQSIGPAPTSAGHTITPLAANAGSTTGTEQFGINLVANTTPQTIGADPVQVPDSTFSYGTAATNYNTANSYRYVNGDIIARATKSSGETDYMISYLVNIAPATPAGVYTMAQALLVVGTY